MLLLAFMAILGECDKEEDFEMRKEKIWVKRAARTFFQTAVGYMVTAAGTYCSGVVDFSDKNAIISAISGVIISAVSAGIAAVMNLKEE